MASGSVVISQDQVPLLLRAVEDLTRTDVLVGIPGTTAERKPEGGHTAPVNNAALGYIHEFGLPEHNIPARPFLRPGITEGLPRIINQLRLAARRTLDGALHGDHEAGTKALEMVGLTAQNAVRAYINRGVAPPLAEFTLRKRMATKGKPKKGAAAELARRATGAAPGIDLAKPLIWTGQLRNSITYVLRPRRR